MTTTSDLTAGVHTLRAAAALLPEPWPRGATRLTVRDLTDAGFDENGIERLLTGFAQETAIESVISLFKGSDLGSMEANDAIGWFLWIGESDGRTPTRAFMVANPGSWLPWAAGLTHEEITAGDLPDEDMLRAMAVLRGFPDTAAYRP